MAKTKKKSKKGLVFGILAVVVIAGLITAPMLAINKGTLYMEETVKKGSIETYNTFSGNVESKNTQNVMAEKVLQISDIKAARGDKVEKDAVLFKTTQGEEIKAKVAGTVSKVYVEEGASVMAGTKLCDIIDFNNLQVTVKVDEYDLSCITKDKKIAITIGAIDKEITGTISDISDTAINQNGIAYFTAAVDLTKDSAIKVGMTAEAKILNKSAKDVLTITMKALQFDEDDKPYVNIKDDKGMPVKRFVKVGINDGKRVEISDGLTAGQVIMNQKNEESSKSGGVSSIIPPIPGR